MEDFLRDSLGIVEESAVQVTYEEVSNVSFTSVLASIEEEDVNNQDAVEDEPHVKDVLVTRRELSPSLEKQLAQRAALLKLGFDSDKEEGENWENGFNYSKRTSIFKYTSKKTTYQHLNCIHYCKNE